MERTYTVLLDQRAGRRPVPPVSEPPLEMANRLLTDPPQPVLHREKLALGELAELSAEPEFVAAAEIMRTRLIAPAADAHEGPPQRGSDRRTRQAWGIAATGADQSCWCGAGVTVAMLDTGIDELHPAFSGVKISQRDFTGVGNGDTDGHGTHCAGIVFGRDVGGVRTGIAQGVRNTLIGKILGPQGGDTDMLARGIQWAVEGGAHIVSVSVEFDFEATVQDRMEQGWPPELVNSVALEAYRANLHLLERLLTMLQLQESVSGGAIFVAAAGNASRRGARDFVISPSAPAAASQIISVASLDPDRLGRGYTLSGFSNSGATVSAPGRDVLSAARGGGLKTLSGTTMACAHVAGVTALWWEAVKSADLPANATIVRSHLLGNSISKGFAANVMQGEHGAGRVWAPRELPTKRTIQRYARSPATQESRAPSLHVTMPS